MWADLCECEQERAAILEYDAGMSREDADRAASVAARCEGCDGPAAVSDA